MRLEELGEFGFLHRIWTRLGAPAPGVILGSGDDAAVLSFGPDRYLLLSTDAVVEGRHFRRDWLAPEQIGARATLAALSDLAAMGGQPRGVLASAALPLALPVSEGEALLAGVESAARAHGASLLGGDLIASPDLIFLDLVAVGETTRFWPRSGAEIGDVVLVSGDLGRSASALGALLSGCAVDSLPPPWRERFLTPAPAFDLVSALACLDLVTSAIDISDGVVGDLRHVAEASSVQIALDASLLPLGEGVTDLSVALTSGEEYELALTVPREAVARVCEAAEAAGARPLTIIGEVRGGTGVVVEGTAELRVEGFDQFTANVQRADRA